MLDSSFIVKIEKAAQASLLSPGVVWPPVAGEATVGRSTDADVQLPDPSVSSQHLHLKATAGGFRITVLAQHGTTYINRVRVEPNAHVDISDRKAFVQVGRVLLKITMVHTTVPFEEPPFSLPPHQTDAGALYFLTIADGVQTQIWARGHELSLYPSAARVLVCLCRSPGAVVTHDELRVWMDPEGHDKAGGMMVKQAITFIRQAFAALVDDARLHDDDLRLLLNSAAHVQADALAGADTRALLRLMFESIRGVGYRLNVSPLAIATHGPNVTSPAPPAP